MSWIHALTWGFAATLLLTTLIAASRGLGLTRMDISYLLGSIFTSNRDRAKWLGFVLHILNGWIFAVIYLILLDTAGLPYWWFGMLVGLFHSLFVLAAGMPILPHIHPHMATEQQGPDAVRQLEPPGFMALNYGRGTPIATILAHLAYGSVLGLFFSG